MSRELKEQLAEAERKNRALHVENTGLAHQLKECEQACESWNRVNERLHERAQRWKALAKRMRLTWLSEAEQFELISADRNRLAMLEIQAETRAHAWKRLAKRLRMRWSSAMCNTQVAELAAVNAIHRLQMVTADPETLASQLLSKQNALAMASTNMDRAIKERDAAQQERDAWVDRCDRLKRELKESAKLRDALKVALETTLKNQGAGQSPYARSQPSDACEIEMWKARVDLDDQNELRLRDAIALLEESKLPYSGGLSFGEKRDAFLKLLATPDAEKSDG